MSEGIKNGWIGVDLDGCLARYEGWKGIEHIGEPVPAMLDRVHAWIDEGKIVKIFTARIFRRVQLLQMILTGESGIATIAA